MDCRLWVQRLRTELARHRLPQAYIDRVVEEMGDHHSELLKEHAMSDERAAERLGNIEWLARQMADRYPRRTLAGRHPWLTFVVLPVPLLFAAWATVVAFTLLTAWAVEAFGVPSIDWSPEAARFASSLGTMALCFLPPAAVVVWVLRAARESGASWRLPSAGLGLVALLAFLFHGSLHVAPESGESHLRMGLTLGAGLLSGMHALQLLAPLAVAGIGLAWMPPRTWRGVGCCE